MKRVVLLAPLALLACSGGSSTPIQPGQWEMTTQFSTVEAPGMPEAALKAMQSQLANQRQTQSTCVTPQQAANPGADIVKAGDSGEGGCTFSDSTFSGGRISVHGTCPGPGGQRMTMAWEGSYTATTMDGRFTTEVQGGPQSMRMVGTMTGRRTGECRTG